MRDLPTQELNKVCGGHDKSSNQVLGESLVTAGLATLAGPTPLGALIVAGYLVNNGGLGGGSGSHGGGGSGGGGSGGGRSGGGRSGGGGGGGGKSGRNKLKLVTGK